MTYEPIAPGPEFKQTTWNHPSDLETGKVIK